MAVIALHAGLAIAIKILFFAHGSPAAKGGPGSGAGKQPAEMPPKGDAKPGDDAAAGDGVAMFARMLFRL